MNYLKDKQYYVDRYDLTTINESLKILDICTNAYIEGKKNGINKGLTSAGEWAKASNWLSNQMLYQIIGNRFRLKEETISKWISDDERKQNKYDTTPEPRDIFCPECGKAMQVGIKEFDFVDTPLRMMFIFECTKCKKKLWIYEDGQIRKSEPPKCPQCAKDASMSLVKEGKDKVIWKITCSSCGFIKTTVDDFGKNRLEQEKREKQDKYLLDTYRKVYCSDEEGKKALQYIDGLPVAHEVYEEQLRKYDSPAYQNVISLKKLSIIELEKLLTNLFEKERYIHLVFGQPELGQHVIVGFTVQDTDTTNRPTIAIHDLQKIIKENLESTNWRLMTDSLSSRLGYVTGKLKGYEREEDFFEIAGAKPEKEKPSKIDPNIRMEHEADNVVQLARLSGEFEGIQNARKRRLKHDPDGFFLEGDGVLTCGICGENYPENKIWWTPDVLRCADCQRNVKNGTIPPLKNRYNDDCGYIEEWFFSSDIGYGIHPSTVKKYKRLGLLKGIDLKREDGSIYQTVYLIKDNQDFLKDHPKKERSHMKITDLLGEVIEI